MSLGGVGVMLVAALPTLGGGIWSSAFLAYGLGLKNALATPGSFWEAP